MRRVDEVTIQVYASLFPNRISGWPKGETRCGFRRGRPFFPVRFNGLRSEIPGAGTGCRKKSQTRFFEAPLRRRPESLTIGTHGYGGQGGFTAAKTQLLGNSLILVGNVKAHAESITDRLLMGRIFCCFLDSIFRAFGPAPFRRTTAGLSRVTP